MAKPFDATTKTLIDAFPQDWLRWLGIAVSNVIPLDSDLSAVTAAADRLLKFELPKPGIVHLELQASYDAILIRRTHSYNFPARFRVWSEKRILIRRTHSYNALVELEHRLPVSSVVILLRKEADQPTMTGVYRSQSIMSSCYTEFGYRVIRLWQEQPETFLRGGLGTLPLAPLTNVEVEALPQVVQQTTQRIESEAKAGVREELLQATALLLGLKFEAEFIRELMKGVTRMKESSVYQAIFADGVLEGQMRGREEGRVVGREEAKRELIFRLGRKRFGEPSAEVVRWLESVSTREALDTIADRLLEVETWDELRG